MENALLNLAIYALPIFLTLTMPIALQAWVANRLGDSTPRLQGRLSWDPMRHMDLLGTIALPAMFLLLSGGFGGTGFLIGWAKPLEINVRKIGTRLQLFLAEAPLFIGPLLMAVLWVLFARLLAYAGVHERFVASVSGAGVNVGLSFFAIALLPFPPMPLGNTILRNLPAKYLYKLLPILQYAPFIVIALLVLGVLNPYLRFVFSIGREIVNLLTFWL
jgi:Zn-dependent protease